jgi:hypothetical protein
VDRRVAEEHEAFIRFLKALAGLRQDPLPDLVAETLPLPVQGEDLVSEALSLLFILGKQERRLFPEPQGAPSRLEGGDLPPDIPRHPRPKFFRSNLSPLSPGSARVGAERYSHILFSFSNIIFGDGSEGDQISLQIRFEDRFHHSVKVFCRS